MLASHENPDRIYTEFTFINPKAHNTMNHMLLSSAEIFEASSANSVDPDETGPTRRTV